MSIIYDMIAVDRAQTVLRYWNWSLSSAMTPALIKAIRDGDEDALDEFSLPQRAAMLALRSDFSASSRPQAAVATPEHDHDRICNEARSTMLDFINCSLTAVLLIGCDSGCVVVLLATSSL